MSLVLRLVNPTVADLIAALREMPQDAPMFSDASLYDEALLTVEPGISGPFVCLALGTRPTDVDAAVRAITDQEAGR